MKEQIGKKLKELREELEKGKQILKDLENQRLETESQMLRIDGAIAVLSNIWNEIKESEKSE